MSEQLDAYRASIVTSDESKRCLMEALSFFPAPNSMADIGCGDGHLVQFARKLLDIDAIGFDLFAPLDPFLVQYDLMKPLVTGQYDLVLCWEVAEHLPISAAETLCDTLVRATGQRLLFSAAIPGQTGNGHVNEQPHEYWRDKLTFRGLRYNEPASKELSRRFLKTAPAAWWYGQNIQVFER